MDTITQRNGLASYQQMRLQDYEQSDLILMLFAGGVGFLDKALGADVSDTVRFDRNTGKAKKVILELISSLDLESGGEMGRILLRTYTALFQKLHAAHMLNDREGIAEVKNSLTELHETWKQVFAGESYRELKRQRARA